MKTNVKVTIIPESVIQMSNIKVDLTSNHFELTLAYTLKGKRKATIETVTGNITPELKDWLMVSRPEKVQVPDGDKTKWVETGNSMTGFEKYLKKVGVEFQPGILTTMTFTAMNNSDDYYQFPFKLVMLKNQNKSVLSLVNVASKERKEYRDPNSGETTVKYNSRFFQNKDGAWLKSYVSKEYYKRLIIVDVQEVDVVETPAQTQAEPQHA